MWNADTILFLSALAFGSAATCIVSDYLGRLHMVYIFKPLTMLIVLALAIQANAETPSYQGLVVAGLLCSLAGDVFLMLRESRFGAGLARLFID